MLLCIIYTRARSERAYKNGAQRAYTVGRSLSKCATTCVCVCIVKLASTIVQFAQGCVGGIVDFAQNCIFQRENLIGRLSDVFLFLIHVFYNNAS